MMQQRLGPNPPRSLTPSWGHRLLLDSGSSEQSAFLEWIECLTPNGNMFGQRPASSEDSVLGTYPVLGSVPDIRGLQRSRNLLLGSPDPSIHPSIQPITHSSQYIYSVPIMCLDLCYVESERAAAFLELTFQLNCPQDVLTEQGKLVQDQQIGSYPPDRRILVNLSVRQSSNGY